MWIFFTFEMRISFAKNPRLLGKRCGKAEGGGTLSFPGSLCAENPRGNQANGWRRVRRKTTIGAGAEGGLHVAETTELCSDIVANNGHAIVPQTILFCKPVGFEPGSLCTHGSPATIEYQARVPIRDALTDTFCFYSKPWIRARKNTTRKALGVGVKAQPSPTPAGSSFDRIKTRENWIRTGAKGKRAEWEWFFHI